MLNIFYSCVFVCHFFLQFFFSLFILKIPSWVIICEHKSGVSIDWHRKGESHAIGGGLKRHENACKNPFIQLYKITWAWFLYYLLIITMNGMDGQPVCSMSTQSNVNKSIRTMTSTKLRRLHQLLEYYFNHPRQTTKNIFVWWIP